MKYFLALALLCLPVSVQAQEPAAPQGHPVRAACSDDMLRLCPDVTHGTAMRDCMASHKQDLSAECSTAMEHMHSDMHSGTHAN